MLFSAQPSLTTLPLEVISIIVKNLESVFDVVHFEQTNKMYRSLVKGSLDIWMHRLKLECRRGNLWWPSYADLSSTAELKDACFAGLRMARAYSLAGPDTIIPQEMTRLDLRFKTSESESGEFNTPTTRGGIQSARLVPGGRYIITLYPGWLTMWDVKSPSSPLLALNYSVPQEYEVFEMFLVEGTSPETESIFVVLITDSLDTSQEDLRLKRRLLKLTYCPAVEGRVVVTDLGIIQLTKTKEIESPHTYVDASGRVLLYSTEEGNEYFIIVVWDYQDGTVSGWRTGNLPDSILETRLAGGHVLFMTANQIYAFEIPPGMPMEDWIDLSATDPDDRGPPVPIAHMYSLKQSTAAAALVTATYGSPVSEILTYFVPEYAANNILNHYDLHWISANPSLSYTVRTHTAICNSPDRGGTIWTASGNVAGTVVADIYEGKDGSRFCGWISLLKWRGVPEESQHLPASNLVGFPEFSCDMVPFIPWDNVRPGHGPVGFCVCPVSGTALAMWSHMEGEERYSFWLAYYSFR